MNSFRGLIRGAVIALGLIGIIAGIGYGAAGGNQTVTITAGAAIDITVPATATIASTNPPNCGTTSTSITVKSNKAWNLQIRSDPTANPAGKATNTVSPFTPMQDVFQYDGGNVASFTNITTTYANLFTSSQPKSAGTSVTVNYQQCVEYLDDPGTYQITVNYLGVQP